MAISCYKRHLDDRFRGRREGHGQQLEALPAAAGGEVFDAALGRMGTGRSMAGSFQGRVLGFSSFQEQILRPF